MYKYVQLYKQGFPRALVSSFKDFCQNVWLSESPNHFVRYIERYINYIDRHISSILLSNT